MILPESNAETREPDGYTGMTRRALLLSLPAFVVARRLVAEPYRPPLALAGIHQITLAVSEVERSVAFYQGLFGMSVQARRGPDVLLRIGAGPQYLALIDAGDEQPRIDHFGVTVTDFDADRVRETLRESGVEPIETPSLRVADHDRLVITFHPPTDCGSARARGDGCASAEPPPEPGLLRLSGISHLTMAVPDPARSNTFYQETFGLDVQAMQANAPALGVGAGVHFVMFIGSGGGRGSAPRNPARIHHACFGVEAFTVEGVQARLESFGIQPRGARTTTAEPLRHWVSMRMPNRGGAPEGTPELYFSDPDGLAIQLQDASYCGGGGYLGNVCP